MAQEYAWIQFTPVPRRASPPAGEEANAVIRICTDLAPLDLLSSYPAGATYGGKPVRGSNGNVSHRIRCGDSAGDMYHIVMTATQLESKARLSPADLALVRQWNTTSGEVTYDGLRAPTSEFWLHEGLYSSLREVGCIAHVHPPIGDLYPPLAQRRWRDLKIVETGEFVPDGTQEVPKSVLNILRNALEDYVVLTGHGTPWDPGHIGAVVMDNDPERLVARVRHAHGELRKAIG